MHWSYCNFALSHWCVSRDLDEQLILFGLRPCEICTHILCMTHEWISKLTTTSPDNGLSPGGCQTIICTNAGILVNSTLRNKLQWNFNQNSHIFIEENAFENAITRVLFWYSFPELHRECWNSFSLEYIHYSSYIPYKRTIWAENYWLFTCDISNQVKFHRNTLHCNPYRAKVVSVRGITAAPQPNHSSRQSSNRTSYAITRSQVNYRVLIMRLGGGGGDLAVLVQHSTILTMRIIWIQEVYFEEKSIRRCYIIPRCFTSMMNWEMIMWPRHSECIPGSQYWSHLADTYANPGTWQDYCQGTCHFQ